MDSGSFPPASENEVLGNADRLSRLRATFLLDAPAEEAFDRLTRLAAKLLNAPVSTVTLVDDERQFYASCTGIPEPLATSRQTPLEYSFCRHTVVLGKPLIIPDVREHPLVSGNPSIEIFGVTAYAGIPLLTADGYALGTLCVMDFKVRHWTPQEISSLSDLAAAVSTEIELRMDIAERKRVEEALKREVALREEVLGVVSHDLRNPVHTIGLASGFLSEIVGSGTSEAAMRKQLDIISRAAHQMDYLIRDLLDVASISSNRLGVELGPHLAATLLNSACELFRTIVAEAGLQLSCEAEGCDVEVLADADRILQLLSNLVGNAIKFTPPGGRLELACTTAEDMVTVRVSDTGSGIPADALPHVFEQFWQGRKAGRHGAGLGLAIAKGIVTAHGGEIWVESRTPTGTSFFFTLPKVSTS